MRAVNMRRTVSDDGYRASYPVLLHPIPYRIPLDGRTPYIQIFETQNCSKMSEKLKIEEGDMSRRLANKTLEMYRKRDSQETLLTRPPWAKADKTCNRLSIFLE